ncbi:flavodoxin domain-containing protein [Clostridium omnivorum]|uniref:Flavodoxin n=1 Tax=Clostridium omnivorum TaxID=1604902 RepID=A0ABQ5N8N6_9CLOT|nr:flavodoxin domain-containing protein [Clostridium sp. E14]GLC31603.1 flavodoxin [Clostridium sp. E14]
MKSIIIYSTKHGTTEKAARILSAKLPGEVVLKNIMKENVSSLEEYDNVILGGSIYIGKVQKNLTEYMQKNLKELLSKRVSLFLCAGETNEELAAKQIKGAFPEELYKAAICKDSFGFEFNFDKLNFFEKLIMKKVKGVKESYYELKEDSIDRFAKVIASNK